MRWWTSSYGGRIRPARHPRHPDSPAGTGEGWVRAAQRRAPVPPRRRRPGGGAPIGPNGPVRGEATTPTGAALLRALSTRLAPAHWRAERSGWGAGGPGPRWVPERASGSSSRGRGRGERVSVLAVDLDDMSPSISSPCGSAGLAGASMSRPGRPRPRRAESDSGSRRSCRWGRRRGRRGPLRQQHHRRRPLDPGRAHHAAAAPAPARTAEGGRGAGEGAGDPLGPRLSRVRRRDAGGPRDRASCTGCGRGSARGRRAARLRGGGERE